MAGVHIKMNNINYIIIYKENNRKIHFAVCIPLTRDSDFLSW